MIDACRRVTTGNVWLIVGRSVTANDWSRVMQRKRSISSLVASIVIIAVTIAVAIALAGYALGLFANRSLSVSALRFEKVHYYYFTYKPIAFSSCTTPPCGLLLARVYVEGGQPLPLHQVSFAGYTWNLSACDWKTTRRGSLDPGENILVLMNPHSDKPCIIVSKEANPRVYSFWDSILAKDAKPSLLTNVQRYALRIYATLSVAHPEKQWLYVIAGGTNYQQLVTGKIIGG